MATVRALRDTIIHVKKGDVIEVSDAEARIMVAYKTAELVVEEQAAPKAPKKSKKAK